MNIEEITLSQAASIMKSTKSTPEQRKLAAKVMGRKGGLNSHNNDKKKVSLIPTTQAIAEPEGTEAA